MKKLRLVLFGLFIAVMVWGTWLAASTVVVWYVPDPTEYEIDITFLDWLIAALPGAGLLFIFSLIAALFLGVGYGWVFKKRTL